MYYLSSKNMLYHTSLLKKSVFPKVHWYGKQSSLGEMLTFKHSKNYVFLDVTLTKKIEASLDITNLKWSLKHSGWIKSDTVSRIQMWKSV